MLRHRPVLATLALFALGTTHAAEPERYFVDHDGARVQARCRGDTRDPLIVLLHGLGGYEVTVRRYAGADHGFDFDWSSASAVDARERVVAFFGRQLGQNAR